MKEIKDCPVMVHITSQRQMIANQLFEELFRRLDQLHQDELEPEAVDEAADLPLDERHPSGYRLEPLQDAQDEADEQEELFAEGILTVRDGQVSLKYEESVQTGMDGTHSELLFSLDDPTLVHLTRSGPIASAMTFKPRSRVVCTYKTPYLPFQLGIHCLSVSNELLEGGLLCLNYILEIRGGCTEWCRMQINFKAIE